MAGPTAVSDTLRKQHQESAVRSTTKSTLADWTADGDEDDINGFYAGEKRQTGGRKKRKKNKEASHIPQNWDDIYDPSRPNNYEEYSNSDERVLEVREWKDRLYAHRTAHRHDLDTDRAVEEYPGMANRDKPEQSSERAVTNLGHRLYIPHWNVICSSLFERSVD